MFNFDDSLILRRIIRILYSIVLRERHIPYLPNSTFPYNCFNLRSIYRIFISDGRRYKIYRRFSHKSSCFSLPLIIIMIIIILISSDRGALLVVDNTWSTFQK